MNALFLSKGLRGKAEMASLVSLQESQNSLNDYSTETSCTSIKSLLYNHHPVMASHATLDRYWLLEKVEQVCTSLQQGCLPSTQSLDPTVRANVLQLVYEVLQCRPVIEEMLIESSFYSRFFKLHQREMLVTVMAYGLVKDKFSTKPPRDWGNENSISDDARLVAEALWTHKVKLGATISRMKVRGGALNISQLLPDPTREQFMEATSRPLYARVVREVDAVASWLRSAELNVIGRSDQQAGCSGSAQFVRDDLLAFSPDCRTALWGHEIVDNGLLIPQDLMSYSCVAGIESLLKMEKGPVDVLLTHCDSGVLPMHIASILGSRGKVLVCGALPVNMKTLGNKFEQASIKNIELLPVLFTNMSPKVELFQDVKLVFCNPPCTMSAVKQPVDFLMQEGDEFALKMFALDKNDSIGNLSTLSKEQTKTLECALKFDQAQHVIYFVRSDKLQETENIVSAVAPQNTDSNESKLFEACGPALTVLDMPGYCFIFKHVPPKPPPAASDIIARAINLGIINSEGLSNIEAQDQSTTKTSKRSKHHKSLMPSMGMGRATSYHAGIPMTISAQQKVKSKKKKPTFYNSKPFKI